MIDLFTVKDNYFKCVLVRKLNAQDNNGTTIYNHSASDVGKAFKSKLSVSSK